MEVDGGRELDRRGNKDCSRSEGSGVGRAGAREWKSAVDRGSISKMYQRPGTAGVGRA